MHLAPRPSPTSVRPRKELMDAELWDGSCCRGSDLSIILPRDLGAQGLLGGGGGSSCPCRGCLEQGTSGWDCRRTALAGIILLIPKHRFGAISRRSETKQQLPGPKRRTSGFISSSLDPLCTYLPCCFPSSNRAHQAQPAQVGLVTGQLNSFGSHGMKSQPLHYPNAEACLLYILQSSLL